MNRVPAAPQPALCRYNARSVRRPSRHLGLPVANRRILSIAWPVVLSALSQTLLVNVDFMLVGWLSTDALAGVGQAGTFMTLFLILCGSLSFGLSTAIAQRLGARDPEAAGRIAVHGVLFGLLLGGLLTGLAAVGLGPTLGIMGMDAPVEAAARDYGRVFVLSLLLAGPAAMANAVFTGFAWTRPVLIASIILVVVNLVGDWLLIFGSLGCPRLGVAGAAWASVIASAASLAFQLAALAWRRRALSLSLPRSPRRFAATAAQVTRLGITTTAEWAMWFVGIFVLTVWLGPFGGVHLAVWHVQMKVQSFLMLGIRGLSTANNAMIGRAHGGAQPTRIGLWHGHNLRLGWLSLIPAVVVLLGFPASVFALFNLSADDLATVAPPRLLGGILVVVLGLRLVNIITGSSLRSVGVMRFFFYLTPTALAVVLLAGVLLIRGMHWGALGAILAMGIDEAWRTVLLTRRFGVLTRATCRTTPART